MARPPYQLPPASMSGCSKSPLISGQGTGANSMAWVKLFRRPGGALKKSYQPGSMLSLALTKGLLNEPGQNSCFLNSAVQVLWQLDIFRRSLRQLSGHFCLGDACIFCALKSIFSQFQQSRERALPSDTLRNALAETFKDEQRFQLGHMDDAAECFENILERIHLHIVSDTATDGCSSKSCITHQKFAMTLYEQFVCRSCGASSDPHPFTELVHYVSTTALCQQVDLVAGKNDRQRSDMFGELLQAANTIGDLRICPSKCGQSIRIRRVLMNCPEIVTIGFVWDAEQSDLTDDVIRSLGPRLNLSGLFSRVADDNAKRSELHLVGMICFSSKHYSAFAHHTKSCKWVFFDDATVKEIGSKWKDVASKCIRGHFQPLLLFYTNPNGTQISSEDAPRQTTMCSRYRANGLNGELTVKPPPSSPKMEGFPSRGCETSKKDRGHRRADPLQQKGPPYCRTSPPLENGLKPLADPNTKGCHRADKPSGHPTSRGPAEPRGPSSGGAPGRRNVPSPGRPDPDSPCQEPWEGSHGKPKSTWRPVREALNVDSVLSELEQRRQQQQRRSQDAPLCGRASAPSSSSSSSSPPRGGAAAQRGRERRPPAQGGDERKQQQQQQKCLMTIYEDEQRATETESHSSVESDGRAGHQRSGRQKGSPGSVLRASDAWAIQRTESGYESSDRLSSGSANPDSPGVDGTAGREKRLAAETTSQSQSQLHQKQSASRSPSHNGKPQSKTQGKNSEQVLKSSPSSRRKLKHGAGGCRKAPSAERDSTGGGDDRGHGEEGPPASKTSSSEWNSSDDLALSEPEERDGAYRPPGDASEAAVAPPPPSGPQQGSRPKQPPRPPCADLGARGSASQRAHAGAQPERDAGGHAAAFRPRLLREPFPSGVGARPPVVGPHRKGAEAAPGRKPPPAPCSDAGGSKSGSDQERSTASSCESEERPPPGRRSAGAEQGPEVALTTYFNVDNCMTETYRLKYHHQRPLVLPAAVTEHRDAGQPLSSETRSQDLPKSRADLSHNSNKPSAKWNPVTAKALGERGFL